MRLIAHCYMVLIEKSGYLLFSHHAAMRKCSDMSEVGENITAGSCLCGQVHYEINGSLGIFQYCHCSRCRKFTGSAFASNLLVKPDQFRWLAGREHVVSYSPPDTKHFATAFCRCCGSSLPWAAKTGRAVVIPAGTLDDDPAIKPTQNIFCASSASWYTSPSDLPDSNELPPRN